MIKKIIAALIFVSLLIAIPLAIFGVKKIDLGETFLSFMNRVSQDLDAWAVQIPDIPKIPVYENASGFLVVLNALIRLVNTITSIINILSTIINIVIQLLQFIMTMLWDLRYLIEDMKTNGDTSYNWAYEPSYNPLPII